MERNLVKTANQTRFLKENKILFSGLIYLVILLIINIFILSFNSHAIDPTLSVTCDASEFGFEFENLTIFDMSSVSSSGRLTVKTNAPAGYTTTISANSDETDLKHIDNAVSTKISSITSPIALGGSIPKNTWAYQLAGQNNYMPIPKKSEPKAIIATNKASDSVPDENVLSVAVRGSMDLMPGIYRNGLILSTIINPFETAAYLTTGDDFQAKLSELITDKTKIENILRRPALPAASTKVVSIHDPVKPFYEIKAWWDPIYRAVCFYTAADKIYFHEDSKNTFKDLSGLKLIQIDNFDAKYAKDMSYMFAGLRSYSNIRTENINAQSVTNMHGIFRDNYRMHSISMEGFNTENVTDMSEMFAGNYEIIGLSLVSMNTKNVKTMKAMFKGINKLGVLKIDNFDTSNVADMSEMFSGMSSVINIMLGNFNTGNVENMSEMFKDCTAIKSLDLNHFNTSKVTNMNSMFSGANSLTILNIASFNTSKITDMAYMFYQVHSITSLDLGNFNTENVTTMEGMFAEMKGIVDIYLTNFKTPKLTNVSKMFQRVNPSSIVIRPGEDNLEHIYAKNDFDISNITEEGGKLIFDKRRTLRGGKNSRMIIPANADKSWLRIDKGSSAKGYFTEKK